LNVFEKFGIPPIEKTCGVVIPEIGCAVAMPAKTDVESIAQAAVLIDYPSVFLFLR